MLFCSVHSPPITRPHAPIDARRIFATTSPNARRTPPAHAAASRPLHARTDEAAVLRWQRSRRRGSRPARVARSARMPHPPALASRPLHARTAMKPPCSRQRARRFPPREWHAHRGPPARPPPSPRHVRCMRDGRAIARRPHATAAPRLPPPASRGGCPERQRSAARPRCLCGSRRYALSWCGHVPALARRARSSLGLTPYSCSFLFFVPSTAHPSRDCSFHGDVSRDVNRCVLTPRRRHAQRAKVSFARAHALHAVARAPTLVSRFLRSA